MKNGEIVVTQDLVKHYGEVAALRGLNLRVVSGICGFIGPNGAGKTTTLRILVGLSKADAGEAYMFGLDCWSEAYEVRRRVGVLHEKPYFPKNVTGLHYLKHVAKLYEIFEPDKQTTNMFKEVGLYNVLNREIGTYSAGMVQRLGLAQALISNPELAILDEPTANLDPLGRMEFLDMIKRLHKELNVNFLISTHILPELERVCSWVSIVKDGVIRDQGPIRELMEKYLKEIYRIDVSNPSLVVKELMQLDVAKRVWINEGFVYVDVAEREQFFKELPTLISKHELELREMITVGASLENVFKRVVTEYGKNT